jgi:hypothetical protein
MNRKIVIFILALLIYSGVYAGNVELVSSIDQSVLLKTGSIYHRLSIRQSNSGTVVVDTLFYFQPPTSPMSYDDFLAGYQGLGSDPSDTCINRFTLLAPGKVTKLMMQNSSTGHANWYLWAPAVVDGNYLFPGDTESVQLIEQQPATDYCPELVMSQQTMDSLVWNTYDLEFEAEAVIELDSSQLDFWVGYSMDVNGNPKIWQDGVYHYPYLEGSCRSFSTLHSQTVGKWYRNVQPGTDNWVAHMMQIEVVYESIPPIITDLPDLCDTFSESRTIWAQIIEIEGDSFDAFLTVRIGRNGAPDTLDMVYNGDNYFWADISYSYGDTLYYYVWARDSERMAQVSTEKSFVCVEPPQETHILLIDDSKYGSGSYYIDALEVIDSSYYYWNMEDHNGIDSTVLHYGGFQTLIVLDGDNQIVPVTDIYEQDIYNIADFLDRGGNLMLVDMDYLYRRDMIGAGRFELGDFAYDFLGIEDFIGDPDENFAVEGGDADTLMLSIPGNPVTSIDTTVYGPVMYRLNGVENWADFIESNLAASGILKGKTSGNGMAVCLDGLYFRTITFAFPIELAADPAEFINLLDSSLQWLGENSTRFDSASGLIQEEQPQGTQSTFRLNDNYPNPFNPTTVISFNLSREETVDLTVYNIKGEVVVALINQAMTPGNYTIDWTAVNERNIPLPSGVYFYSLSTKKQSVTKKMILLR